jgi:DNA polymerase-3 subunit chi
MTELVFYHLERQPVERVLPALIEKSLERGWRVVVQAASAERIEALDAQLWTFRDDSFLPHGTAGQDDAREQPVLLTLDGDNRNGAAVRFLVDGVPVPADAESYARIVLLFDGADPDAVAAARACRNDGKAKGFAVTWWQTDAEGRWRRRTDDE